MCVPTVRRALASSLSLFVFATGCASNSAARRATVLADADRAAKAVIEKEAQLDVSKIPARTFAVLPFAAAASDTILEPLRFGLATLLTNDLSTSPSLQMVERLNTDAILRELKMVDEGLVDPRGAPRVGRLVGARRVLIGDASRVGNTIRLSARVVDIISGTVQQLLTAEAPLDHVIDAEKELALRLFERLGITLTPAQRTRVERRQTSQTAALIAFGKGVEAEAKGDAKRAEASYQEAVRLDPSFNTTRTLATTGTVAAAASGISNVGRVLDLGAQAINTPVIATRTSDVANPPFAGGGALTLTFIIRVTP